MGCHKDWDPHLAGPLSHAKEGQPPCCELPRGETHVARNGGKPSANTHGGIRALPPTKTLILGFRELNLGNIHLSELESQSLHVQP